jgi:hypothetical protein
MEPAWIVAPRGRRRWISGVAALILLALHGPAGGAGMPDLRLDTGALARGVTYDLLYFAPDACELQAADLCVGAPGARIVMRFDTFAVNDGDVDLILGVPDPSVLLPSGEPEWIFSQCHNHFHFQTFARYELRRRGETATLLQGQKRSFCVEDTKPDTATTPRRYCCAPGVTCELTGHQGVQPGWGDLYPSNLPCQWIDVTDLEGQLPLDADLCVFLNYEHILPDADPTNDNGCVPVSLDAPPAGAKPPRVKVTAPTARVRAVAGRALKVAWRRHAKGDVKFQELWFSSDDGATWQLIGGGPTLPRLRQSYKWTVPAGTTASRARLKVVVWTRNADGVGPGSFQRGIGLSKAFRIGG